MVKVIKPSSRRKPTAAGKKQSVRKAEEILRYQDQYIVVDTATHFIFIGRLRDISDFFITLSDADVHASRESPSMKEKYIIDSKKYGVRINRKQVHIRLEEVISFSSLNDVIEY
ncbi:MAG: hypothetical protein ABII26_11370 [Pseudomonadota bacterium]